jgi:excisionase family DNA binding protein
LSSTLSSTLEFLNFLPFAYAIILGFIAWLVDDAIHNPAEKLNSENKLIVAAVIIAIGIILLSFWQKKEYRPEIYYHKCKQDFEEQKQQEESLKSLQKKLVNTNGKEIPIPESTYQVLRKVTEIMASGQAVFVLPQKDKVSIQEAADILNVSPPFLVKLLEQGNIPSTQVGSGQYIRFEDLISYKKQRDMERREGLKELTQFLQEEGFYEENRVKFDS